VDRNGLKALAGGAARLGKAGFAFKGIETQCAECHLDPHGGRFERSGPRAAPGGCLACHDAKSFRPAAVDVAVHDRFRFRLGGAHRATPCASCHRELGGAATGAVVSTLAASGSKLRPSRFEADTTCASCHATVHGNQFDGRKGGAGCEGCHGDDGFVPASRFNHDRDASFALGSGHQRVPCVACHRATVMVGGVSRVVYRPLSGKCESCHLKKPGPVG
jgi:ribosomal protein L34E